MRKRESERCLVGVGEKEREREIPDRGGGREGGRGGEGGGEREGARDLNRGVVEKERLIQP